MTPLLNHFLSIDFKRCAIMLCGMTLLMSANALFAQSRGIQLEPVPVAQVATTPFSNGTYRALIIGNNNYRDGKGHWPPLKTAITDAKASCIRCSVM